MSKSNWLPDEKQNGNFSNEKQDTFDPGKRYIGIRLQQGVPLLDRDWNELEDMRRHAEVMLRRCYIGNGTPDDGFKISLIDASTLDFRISSGRCLVDGFDVVNEPYDESGNKLYFILYSQQEGIPAITPPGESRVDTVYLDVWVEEVSAGQDSGLGNSQDIDMETCRRHKLEWRVRVDEGSQGYEKQPFHHYYDIAKLSWVSAGRESYFNVEDLRVTELALHSINASVKAKGVTNGDNHNHSSGDGAPINHSSLNKDDGTNPHGTTAADVGALPITGGNVNGNLAITGNVGIGTTNPLSVVGNGSLKHSLETTGWILARGSGENTWGDPASRIGVMKAGGSDCDGWWISANPNNTFAIHQACVGDRLTIDTNGNVGIGTVPTTYKLQVQGNALFTGNYFYVNSENAGRLRVGAAWNMPGLYSSDDGPRDLTLGVPPGKRVYLGVDRQDAWVEGGSGNSYFKGSVHIGAYKELFFADNGQIRSLDYNHRILFRRTENKMELREYGDIVFSPGATSGNETARAIVTASGQLWAASRTGAPIDYAEYFESKHGKEIKPGTSVVLDDGKIRPAKKDESPFGIISANPLIAGGVPMEWPKKYLRDEFGNQIMEEYQEEIMAPKKEKVKKERQKMEKKTVKEKVTRTEIVRVKGKYCQKEVIDTIEREIEEPVFKEVNLYDAKGKDVIGKHRIPVMETYEEEIDVLDENGQPVMVGTGKFETKTRPKINPEYDETKEYIPREKRPEWNCVGLLGQL
ncbi:MAG: hypothetical protein GTO45_00680, partial [Candidatus Aminicenantes bacterium]|nr:hypothetical protein [Candidatus Aminicenantes bacterium]NIM77277.1 hypothetical protein [Candidatus Aminicenantes bacterium]NIN16578.1 hypothetical protein [Candidatus Aminicenantes bacterium]NIN40436.1 hypothetical protein [Candidatus Aminicenantes bacterium]NIN83256.1 hypothetical protein [Candidatus Aminicenantes bacterium]